MNLTQNDASPVREGYLLGPRQAWFAFAMTLALLMFDYIDRFVIVSLFPILRKEWGLSDTQLGALASVVSITVAIGAVPVALFADRVSRVKSIVAMATVWSLATISCMFTRGFGQLFAARSLVGLGEAGYGSVGAALIASHFPSRMRGALMAAFFAAASVGSVLGVALGGVIAVNYGWKAAFGVVGVPGLLFVLLYLKVRDYKTVELTPRLDRAARSTGSAFKAILRALGRSRTMLWVCVGAAAQLIVVSAIWNWLPSYLQREHGMPLDVASLRAAVVMLACAAGSVVWGVVVDRAGARKPRAKLTALALLCCISLIVLSAAFGAPHLGIALSTSAQYWLILAGSFVMTCTVGPVSAIVIDVIHPGIRATGASVLALFQNMFGLALGPIIAGRLSDMWDLSHALMVMPMFSLIAAGALLLAARSYEGDMQRAGEEEPAETSPPAEALRQAF
jgi:MFS family permease